MRNYQTSKTSQEIIELLQSGKRQFEVRDLGYSIATVRYYHRKLFNLKQHKRFIKQVSKCNKAILDKAL
jgi:hypothetical protein